MLEPNKLSTFVIAVIVSISTISSFIGLMYLTRSHPDMLYFEIPFFVLLTIWAYNSDRKTRQRTYNDKIKAKMKENKS